jgi:hypothetical protein
MGWASTMRGYVFVLSSYSFILFFLVLCFVWFFFPKVFLGYSFLFSSFILSFLLLLASCSIFYSFFLFPDPTNPIFGFI